MNLKFLAVTRVRAVVGVVTMLVTALALSSCTGSASKMASHVPWLALTPDSTTTTTSTTTTLAAFPPCMASQLRTSMGQGEAGMSNEGFLVLITNVGGTCRLSGYPDLVGHTATRRQGQLGVSKSGTYFGNMIPANISTGHRGELLLGTNSACNALNEPSRAKDIANARANTYHGVIIVLPNGAGSLTVPDITFDAACGLYESQLGVQAPTPNQYIAPPGSPQSLQASVTMPRSVQSGTRLQYIVSLHNPDTRAVTWTDCPNYTELIFTTPQVAQSKKFLRTYQLNCGQAADVGPGRTETFVMELPVGSVRTTSEAKFSWQLDTGYGPYAGRAVRVIAAR